MLSGTYSSDEGMSRCSNMHTPAASSSTLQSHNSSSNPTTSVAISSSGLFSQLSVVTYSPLSADKLPLLQYDHDEGTAIN